MSTIAVLITALALAMDAMSLSIYQGIASTENQRKQNFIKIILTFGIFQFAMALVGSLSGSLFVHYISFYTLAENKLFRFRLLRRPLLLKEHFGAPETLMAGK